MMNPLIPISIIIILSIVGIVAFTFVIIPEYEKQQAMNDLLKCEEIKDDWNYNPFAENGLANEQLVKDYTECVDGLWENYATDEDWENRKNVELAESRSVQDYKNWCNETYLGQLEHLTDCLDEYGDFPEIYRLTKEFDKVRDELK
jgi:hypothetical protein